MNAKTRKFISALTTWLVIILVTIAILLVAAYICGVRAYTVLSGSMEPTYHVGSLLFVKKADPMSIQAGDPITFLLAEKTVVTHRVVDVIRDDGNLAVRYRTKGDANNIEDSVLVHSNNLLGKPVFSIPLLGYVANAVQTPPGMYIAIAVEALLLLIAFWPVEKEEQPKKGSPRQEDGKE